MSPSDYKLPKYCRKLVTAPQNKLSQLYTHTDTHLYILILLVGLSNILTCFNLTIPQLQDAIMSGALPMTSKDDCNKESSIKNVNSNEPTGALDSQFDKPESSDNSTTSHEIYKVQKKLESYTKRLSQLGLGLDSETSSDELSQTSSNCLVPEDANKINVGRHYSVEIAQLSTEEGPCNDKIYSRTKLSSPGNSVDMKVKIKFQPIGSIPPLKPKDTCVISYNKPFSTITLFLKKRIKVDHVFCYVNNSFAPSPNERIGDLWSQFKVNDELIISYCAIVAFG